MTPTRTRKSLTVAAGVATAAALALGACSSGGAPSTTSTGGGRRWRGQLRLHLRHDHPRDARATPSGTGSRPGANQAAKDTGSTLKYSSDPDASKQAVLIQNAIDSKVDGIATTLVTPDALIPSIKKAVAAGIPVDTFNSGIDFFQQAGALTHFASNEKLAGQAAGKRAAADGATKILCTIQQSGSVALEDRCAGVKDAFPNTENLQVNGADDAAVTTAIQAKLTEDKSINWVITLGAPQALDTIKAAQGAGVERQDRDVRHQPGRGPGGQATARSSGSSTSSPTCRATWPSPSSTCSRRTATSSVAARPC